MNMFTNMFSNAATQTPQQPAQPATPNQPPAAQIQTAPNNVPAVQTPGTEANGVVPVVPETPEAPLDQFKELWDTNPDAPKPVEFTPEKLDPTKLQEVMGKVNLTQAITPELQARINAGGEDANVAFNEAMNIVGQQAMMQSTIVANKMLEQQGTQLMDVMMAKLPGMVKAQTVNSNLAEADPIFNNPAVKPVIDAVKSQLQTKHPDATPTELTTMAQNFVKAMSEGFNPAATPEDAKVPVESDFSEWA